MQDRYAQLRFKNQILEGHGVETEESNCLAFPSSPVLLSIGIYDFTT